MRDSRLKLLFSLVLSHLSEGIILDSAISPAILPDFPSSDRTTTESSDRAIKPHIVVILADDLGWNDVSLHGADQIPTPNIDALAYNGIILNSHYVSAMCTPSRSALMTGKYPIRTGMQHYVLLDAEPRGLPLTEKLLPEYMKDAGYETYAIGKWHLGYARREYTPTYRGFDYHFGYWNGLQDYYNHQVGELSGEFRGFDMRRNMSVAWDTVGKYSTDLFTEEAMRIIEEHDTTKSMFMYLAHLAPHSGNEDDLYQAPDEEIAKFSYIKDPERRTYAAMVSKLDASVGEVISALGRREMLDNSIIVFMSDNGAPTIGMYNNRGSNYPLRGIKNSAWEGGVRGVAAIWSTLIKKPRRVFNQLVSITDWLPTLWSAAGMDINELGTIDGVDVWQALIANKTSPRSEILINIDEIDNYAAIRRNDFKYVIGHTNSGDGWYGDPGRLLVNKESEIPLTEIHAERVLASKAGMAISDVTTAGIPRDSRQRRESKIFDGNDDEYNTRVLTVDDMRKLRSEATLHCRARNEKKIACSNPVESPCLFNIKDDPCEQVNLAAVEIRDSPATTRILASFEEALRRYRATAVPAANLPNDPLANPKFWSGVWINWRDNDTSSVLNAKNGVTISSQQSRRDDLIDDRCTSEIAG